MPLKRTIRVAGAAALSAMLAAGCGRSTGPLQPWRGIPESIVFQDAFPASVVFQPFGGSKGDALTIDRDTTHVHAGTACLMIRVPSPGDPAGTYAGGAVTVMDGKLLRDLTGYDALTFWAKANKSVVLEVAGFGNDNTGTSKFEAKSVSFPLTTSWKKFVIPIPLPARLTNEGGLFFFASGPQMGAGYTLWLDDLQFERLGKITDPRPVMTTQTVNAVVGATIPVTGTRVTFSVLDSLGVGVDHLVQHMPGYFTYASSNPAVATISGGTIHVVGSGNATITARLDTTTVAGTVTVAAIAPPATAAPTPTVPAANVISLFSNAYAPVPVDTWSATWDVADVADAKIAGNDNKLYTNLTYAGIEFVTHKIDATTMTAFHTDVWAPSGTTFKVKLVDFGADGAFGGGDDSQPELTFNAGSTPPFSSGDWVPLEIPLTDFTGLLARAHLAQLIISGDTRTVYVDNVYFHK